MLGRMTLSALNYKYPGFVEKHFSRAMKVRMNFDNTSFLSDLKAAAYIPPCHAVARAYAEAFDVQYQDGWRHTIALDKSEPQPFYKYGHSWNIITTPDGFDLVLDLFPEDTCSLFPILLSSKDARYAYRPLELSNERIALSERFDSVEEIRKVQALKSEFLRIDAL